MIRKLLKHLAEHPRLNSLSENLQGGGGMARMKTDSMDAFHFGLTKQTQTKRSLDKRAGVDLVIGLRNRRDGEFRTIDHAECKSMSHFPVPRVMCSQPFDGLLDSQTIRLVP